MARSNNNTRSGLLIALLLLVSTIASAAAQGASDGEAVIATESTQDLLDATEPNPAPGVDTVIHFPNNPDKSICVGEQAEILVGVSNHGDAHLNVHSVKASLHLPYDHKYLVQDFYSVDLGNATVPKSVQASFPYSFTVSKYLQPGLFDLVATILYEVNGEPHRSVFYNGTIEVVEGSGLVRGETLFLATLGFGIFSLLGVWLSGWFQQLSKKTRKTRKVETGTRSAETLNNEWLQGTAFTRKLSKSIAQPTKSKKKK
eukprot:c43537_g1_i1 orf=80-853(+)